MICAICRPRRHFQCAHYPAAVITESASPPAQMPAFIRRAMARPGGSYRPVNTGWRFSMKLATPSLWSSVSINRRMVSMAQAPISRGSP